MEHVFAKAMSHTRNKTILRNAIDNDFKKLITNKPGNTFEEIWIAVSNICDKYHGLGQLICWDITKELCNHHYIEIDRFYVIGSGPEATIRKLGLKMLTHRVGSSNLKYVDRDLLQHAMLINRMI